MDALSSTCGAGRTWHVAGQIGLDRIIGRTQGMRRFGGNGGKPKQTGGYAARENDVRYGIGYAVSSHVTFFIELECNVLSSIWHCFGLFNYSAASDLLPGAGITALTSWRQADSLACNSFTLEE